MAGTVDLVQRVWTGIEIKGEDEGLIPGRGMFKTNKRSWYDGQRF